MKILVLADKPSPALWDYYTPGRLKEYDLIISCGDLDPSYLSFIVTMARAPLLYVHGNHDKIYDVTPPEGCQCIDDRLVEFKGLRILGLGGSIRYNPGPYQYSQKEMRRRIRRQRLSLKLAGGVDLVVTHAPPQGIGDGEDHAHQGFSAFLELMERYSPAYLLHGHNHLNYSIKLKRMETYGSTKVINAYTSYVVEIPDDELPPSRQNRLWRLYAFFCSSSKPSPFID